MACTSLWEYCSCLRELFGFTTETSSVVYSSTAGKCVCVSIPSSHPSWERSRAGKDVWNVCPLHEAPLGSFLIYFFFLWRNAEMFATFGPQMGLTWEMQMWGHSWDDKETQAAKKGDARLYCYWSRSWESHRQTNCRLTILGRGQPSPSLLLNLTTPWAAQPHFGSPINETPLLNMYHIILGASCLRNSRCVQYLLTVKIGRGIQQKKQTTNQATW